jgi:hypothetical protein
MEAHQRFGKKQYLHFQCLNGNNSFLQHIEQQQHYKGLHSGRVCLPGWTKLRRMTSSLTHRMLENVHVTTRPDRCTKWNCSVWRDLQFTWLTHHSRSWALLEKPPIVQLLKSFPAFYGTRKFVTVFTRALHWSLSWARSIQSIPSHPISLRSIIILFTYLRLVLPSGLFSSGFSTNILYAFLFSTFVLHAPPISSSLTWSF